PFGPAVCPPQSISPAVLYSRRPASSVWAPGCDSLRPHSRVPTALCFMNGPVVFWDLSRVPKDYREDTFRFRSPRPGRDDGTCSPAALRLPTPGLGDQTGSGSGYVKSLQRNFPFWVEPRF
ncbi:unnamed protein product, partial [Staurois parvus]